MGWSKTLSLVAGTLLAAAVWGQPAEASIVFDATGVVATISGEQTAAHTFTFESEVKGSCAKATLGGEMEERAETLTLSPSYAECTSFGLAATVEPNGCKYVFRTGSKTEAGVFSGTTDVTCPKEAGITITGFSGNCQVKIGPQTGLGGVTYRNKQETSPTKVLAEVALNGIKYTVTKDAFLCPFKGTGEKTGGSMAGSSLLKATAGSEGAGFAVVDGPLTRLCAEKPNAKNVCLEGAGLEETALKGAIESPWDPPFEIEILETGVQKKVIDCDAEFSGQTSAETGAPLVVESISFKFSLCETGFTKCSVEMTNAPQTGGLWTLGETDPAWVGEGMLVVQFLLRVDCGAELVKCTYKTPKWWLSTWLEGGAPAELVFKPSLESLKGAGVFPGEEKGCFTEARAKARFSLSEPAAVWVTG
jgi:hypothetical protein